MSDLFRAIGEICRPLGAKPPDLKEYQYDDIGLGWCIHAQYSVEWDEGEPVVTVEVLELNTGNRLLALTPSDIPSADLIAIEGLIADEELAAAHEAALHLHRTRNDDGDYSLDAQRDRLAALEPDESR
jgi:hypothetical protein